MFVKGGPTRKSPKEEMVLESGDVLIMGEEQRLHYHGVKKILAHSAPTTLGFEGHGRINITVRQVTI